MMSSSFAWKSGRAVQFISQLIHGLLISAVALLASLVAMICILCASLGDADLARFVGRFLIDVEFGRHALFFARLVFIAGGIVATTVALNRLRAAELHFEGV